MAYTNSLRTHNGKIGKLGEDYACEYLVSRQHNILGRNIRFKMGEIDIVTETVSQDGKKSKIHIVEVKTSQSSNVRAVENMNVLKMRKVAKLGEMYAKDRLFVIDFVGVTLNSDFGLKHIEYLENIEIY